MVAKLEEPQADVPSQVVVRRSASSSIPLLTPPAHNASHDTSRVSPWEVLFAKRPGKWCA